MGGLFLTILIYAFTESVLYGLLYTDYLTELDKERRFVLDTEANNGSTPDGGVEHGFIAHICKHLQLPVLIHILQDFADEEKFSSESVNSLYKRIFKDLGMVQVEGPELLTEQDIIRRMKEISGSEQIDD